MSMESYSIEIDEGVLTDLRERLRRVRWPDEVENENWARGSRLDYLQELVGYWLEKFDWRSVERRLNELPQFKATIDGLGIHFAHVRGRGPSPLPLVVTHGWPSTFFELSKLLPLLTDPARHGGDPADAFDVVVPSLPGFGFSDRPRSAGVHRRVPELWVELMGRLGYQRFAAQGGDLGGGVTARLGMYHPDRVIGIHVTNVYGSIGDQDRPASEAELRYLAEVAEWETEEGAYGHMQGTRPQTLAFGLNDSPAGLAAWIVEKLRAWSDSGDDIEQVFSKDEILTTVTIYWATQTIASSFLPYYDSRHDPSPRPWQKIDVPCAVALFPRDLTHPPREFAERSYNLRQWTEMPCGGHFAAFEQPELLADDIRQFFRSLR
jgi:pimeloyl-ACP methyl ester carboxylesterase